MATQGATPASQGASSGPGNAGASAPSPGGLAGAGGCAAPDQDALAGPDQPIGAGAGETVIVGGVRADGAPVGGAYVRLLDAGGEFTAEVVASREGSFRFFARPGTWTIRALAPGRSGEVQVTASQGKVTETTVELA
jgi:hypothetical protein